jgi:hypothetical protein
MNGKNRLHHSAGDFQAATVTIAGACFSMKANLREGKAPAEPQTVVGSAGALPSRHVCDFGFRFLFRISDFEFQICFYGTLR